MGKRSSVLVCALLAVTAVLAACGDDDDEPSGATTTAATTATTAAATGDATATTAGSTSDATAVTTAATTAPLEPVDLDVTLSWPEPAPLCCFHVDAALDRGYFDDLNLDVDYDHQTGSVIPIQNLVAGRTDLALATPVAGFGALVAGASDLRFIGAPLAQDFARAGIGQLYGAKEEITGPQDLKGKTMGITSGRDASDANYVIISSLLEDAGISADDVDWAVIGAPALRTQALLAGRIDFTVIGAEAIAIVNGTEGYHALELPPPSSSFQSWQSGVLWWTRTSVLEDPDKAEAIRRYVLGSMQATRDLVADRSLFVEAATSYQSTFKDDDPASTDFVIKWQTHQWMPNGGMRLADMQTWLSQVYEENINPDAAGKIDLVAVTDTSFVEAAIDQLGVDSTATWDPLQLTP